MDPKVSEYTAGLAARAKAAGAEQRVAIPDLGVAAASYRPEKDGPMTLGQIAESQENIKSMSNPTSGPPPKAVLKPETLQGLHALHNAVAAEQSAAQARIDGQTPQKEPEANEQAIAPPAPPKKGMSEEEKAKLAEMSDLDFDLMMSRVRSDVINNAEERKAIESRLKPMDLTDGLLTGEFTQPVEIVPGKLVVTFRTITPFENEQIKRRVLERIMEEEKYSAIHTENYGFMQVVAAVKQLNGREQPAHLKTVGNNSREFMWDVFDKKFELFKNYPGPLIHSLSVHANWFDLRVRALFTNAALKNG